jgi:hypothetical protein
LRVADFKGDQAGWHFGYGQASLAAKKKKAA